MNPPNAPTLLVAEMDDVVWVRVEGRGSFANSPHLKAVVAYSDKRGKHRVVVDLLDSPIMDSTFMGTLTGLAIHLKDKPGGGLLLINANQRNIQLLENLGLDQIIEVDKDGSAYHELRSGVNQEILERLGGAALDKEQHAAHVLEAHQVLADANPANEERFRDVVTYLKSEIQGGSDKR